MKGTIEVIAPPFAVVTLSIAISAKAILFKIDHIPTGIGPERPALL
jgi:hypothetical protein